MHEWAKHVGPGHWNDPDMLVVGHVGWGKDLHACKLTKDEQYTVMTLWSIARSPLMHGGDMTKTDPFTLSLLTSGEVLAVNQHSTNNRPLFDRDQLKVELLADLAGSLPLRIASHGFGRQHRSRQMAAARAMTFTSGVNDSITASP